MGCLAAARQGRGGEGGQGGGGGGGATLPGLPGSPRLTYRRHPGRSEFFRLSKSL